MVTIDINKEVIKTLKDIGVPVSFLTCKQQPKPDVYVTFFEVLANNEDYADDKATTDTHLIQVDIWALYGNSIASLKEKIIKAMENNSFKLKAINADQFEEETNLIHKAIEFYKKNNKEEDD